MTITAASALSEVAWVVCTALDRVGVQVVLTSGSAATFYAPEACQSRDLDFIVFSADTPVRAEGVLVELGYHRAGSHYEHDHNPLILEFPPGPLAVGGEIIENFSVFHQDDHVLRVLTATDCCTDRSGAGE